MYNIIPYVHFIFYDIYINPWLCIVQFVYGVFYFQRELIFSEYMLLKLFILLMHVIEYHFNVI